MTVSLGEFDAAFTSGLDRFFWPADRTSMLIALATGGDPAQLADFVSRGRAAFESGRSTDSRAFREQRQWLRERLGADPMTLFPDGCRPWDYGFGRILDGARWLLEKRADAVSERKGRHVAAAEGVTDEAAVMLAHMDACGLSAFFPQMHLDAMHLARVAGTATHIKALAARMNAGDRDAVPWLATRSARDRNEVVWHAGELARRSIAIEAARAAEGAERTGPGG